MDSLMLHGFHRNSAVQGQRAGNNAAGNTALGDLSGGDGAGHLFGDILHGGEDGHLGAVIAQGLGHGQGIFYDADLRLHIGIDIDSGVGDHDKAALVLENAALAHQTAATGGNQTCLTVQNGTGKVGGLQDALHGDVGLPFLHQLNGNLSGFQLLTIKVDDLIVSFAFAHVVEHLDDLGLFADECTLHHASALGIDHGAQCRLVMSIGQCNALFHILRQNIGFDFLKGCKHTFFLPVCRIITID